MVGCRKQHFAKKLCLFSEFCQTSVRVTQPAKEGLLERCPFRASSSQSCDAEPEPPSSAPSSLEDKKVVIAAATKKKTEKSGRLRRSADASWKSREEERRPQAPTIKARLYPPQSRRPPQQGRRAAEIRGQRQQRGESRKLN